MGKSRRLISDQAGVHIIYEDEGRNVLESFALDGVDKFIIDEETEREATLALESIDERASGRRKHEQGSNKVLSSAKHAFFRQHTEY